MSLDQYIKMHEQGFFPGHSTKKWSEDIKAMLDEHKPRSVLDYGCGKGMQYKEQRLHEDWGIPMPTLYDPAVPEHGNLPDGTFEAVICCDVLEHLEGKDLVDAVEKLMTLATKCLFLSITCRPAKKNLPDGRNCHLTVKPPAWWQGYLQAIRGTLGWCGGLDVVVRFEQ